MDQQILIWLRWVWLECSLFDIALNQSEKRERERERERKREMGGRHSTAPPPLFALGPISKRFRTHLKLVSTHLNHINISQPISISISKHFSKHITQFGCSYYSLPVCTAVPNAPYAMQEVHQGERRMGMSDKFVSLLYNNMWYISMAYNIPTSGPQFLEGILWTSGYLNW